jgi:catechol 2,3-dioxygenase-like lactoylglutathione lyase family enzyme
MTNNNHVAPKVTGVDHFVLPTDDGERLAAFYDRLGLQIQGLEEWRRGEEPIFSIIVGDQKINVHPENVTPRRKNPDFNGSHSALPGCGDFCLVWGDTVDRLLAFLEQQELTIDLGPKPQRGGRAGGTTTGTSVYLRDPDDNLVELIAY